VIPAVASRNSPALNSRGEPITGTYQGRFVIVDNGSDDHDEATADTVRSVPP
jgi:hypothetical protein